MFKKGVISYRIFFKIWFLNDAGSGKRPIDVNHHLLITNRTEKSRVDYEEAPKMMNEWSSRPVVFQRNSQTWPKLVEAVR
ncbi:hypothetical protein BLOT_006851 [Blomia tropicalis]|nr:hypothetical protein BLOT_006851 [Blomia tropicalis]